MVICIMCILLAAGITTIGVRMWQERQADERAARQAEEVKKVIAAGYEEFLGKEVQETASVQDGGTQGNGFAQWGGKRISG